MRFFILILLFSVNLCYNYGFRLKRETKLQAPSITSTSVNEPGVFVVEWDPVRGNPDNPVIGYKLKAWEEEIEKIYHFKEKNGIKEVEIEERPAGFKPFAGPPNTVPKEVVLEGVNNTKGQIDDVKRGVEYELRVLAYTAIEEGPLSNSIRIKIHKE